MTTPAIRAALERLVELDGHLNETSPGWMQAWSDAIAAARAALAEPVREGPVALSERLPVEGEGPSPADIGDLCEEHSFNCDDGESIEILHDMITAALARWGRPVTPPAPEAGEVEG